MAFDLWTYQFCLACDKQVQSDAATYCSEPCQMIDSERLTLPPSSQVSSPGFPPPPTEFYVSWAYGLSTARSCETTAQKRHWIHYMMPDTEQVSSFVATQNLKHVNSHSSLGSMQRMENLSGNVGIVMQALVREIRDETMKQMAKAQQETVKEITTSHERTIETLWNAWEKEQQVLKQMIEGQEKAIRQLQQDIQGIQAQAAQERKLMQEQVDELKRMQQHASRDIEPLQV
ncbi:hypothetical protein FOXG_21847 [Fusarium oxysporum f. sp. lycopersici 4287]|uniref:Uncharacterized protein n=2 Tax=Fusarium oxysporum TaxID=5507 RepID=A0A0J9W284_FUSO4|nr:hypothetical protein FOXG_21847 [Fusarium oxysporum f. sp. lycopersici 4287]KNB16980.1 hypothetical protein FOXG_21847 [Fusarium oxysporum f. sp. lycopersici 4287]